MVQSEFDGKGNPIWTGWRDTWDFVSALRWKSFDGVKNLTT